MNLYRYLPTVDLAATLLLAGLVLLSGCASVPEPVREGPRQSPDPVVVQASPEQYAGMTVRWGGVIVSVENGQAESEVEVVSRPLGDDTRPLDTDQTSGRFLVRTQDFLDPMDYTAGREITVVGILDGIEQRNIGAHRYAYPVVKATGYYLWPVIIYVPDPYYYSPFYDPWYPFGPYYYPYAYPYYSYPYTYPYYRARPPPSHMPPRQPLPPQNPRQPQFQPPSQQPQPQLQPQPRLHPRIRQ